MSDSEPLLTKDESSSADRSGDNKFRPAFSPLSILPTTLSPLLGTTSPRSPRSPRRSTLLSPLDVEAASPSNATSGAPLLSAGSGAIGAPRAKRCPNDCFTCRNVPLDDEGFLTREVDFHGPERNIRFTIDGEGKSSREHCR